MGDANLIVGIIIGFSFAAYLFNAKVKTITNRLLSSMAKKARSRKEPVSKSKATGKRPARSKKVEPWTEH